MPGPTTIITGPMALVYALEDMLKAHLAARVAQIETDMGLGAGAIKVPSTTQGYSRSRKLPTQSGPSVRIFLDEGGLTDQPRFPGAGSAFATTFLRIRLRSFSEKDTDSDLQLNVISEAARWVIATYYPAWWANMRAFKCEVRVDFRGASIRERSQDEGVSSYGRPALNTDEELDLTVEVGHRQGYDMSYSRTAPDP